MAAKPQIINPTLLLWLAVAYHACAVLADTESYARNVRRFGADPTGRNLLRTLAAEGVLIKDLGL